MRTMKVTAMKLTGLEISVDAEVARSSPSGRMLACLRFPCCVIDSFRLFSLSTRHALIHITSASKHTLTSFGALEFRNRNSVRQWCHIQCAHGTRFRIADFLCVPLWVSRIRGDSRSNFSLRFCRAH